MKKSILLLALPLLFLTAPTLQAQNKSSIGLIVGGTMPGISIKASLSDHVFLMSDFGTKSTPTGDSKTGFVVFGSLEVPINIFYQNKFSENSNTNMYWFIGGGYSAGWCTSHDLIKFGANVISGFEFALKNVPISFQLDLRPGYGVLFTPDCQKQTISYGSDWFPFHLTLPYSFFDWGLCFSVRYTFNNHQKQTN